MIRKSLVGKSGIEYTDYYANIYEGCEHNCQYCYARMLKRKSIEEWTHPQPVDNACELIDSELPKLIPGEIMLCSTCDPYQPINRKYGLARMSIQKIMNRPNWTILIQTKSSDVIGDIDLIKYYKDRIKVGMTITSLDEVKRIENEPMSSPILARLYTLCLMHDEGIRTRLSVEPIMPNTSVIEISDLIYRTKDYVDEYIFGKLEHYKLNEENLEHYKIMKKDIEELCNELGINAYFKQKLGNL